MSLVCVIVLTSDSITFSFYFKKLVKTHTSDYILFQGIQYEMQPSRTVAMSPVPMIRGETNQQKTKQYSVVSCVAKLGYGKSSISNDSWIHSITDL